MNKGLHWADIEEVGVYRLMKLMFFLYRISGSWAFRLILYPVVAYYYLSNKTARDASMEFLETIADFDKNTKIKATRYYSFRHFLNFAEAMLDKLSAWNNKLSYEKVKMHEREQVAQCLQEGRGAMILGSHLGNAEVCRALVTISGKVKLNILVHTKHAKNFNRLLGDVSDGGMVELLQVTNMGPDVAIMLDAKIQAGEFIFIVGDRVPVNGGRVIRTEFLGKETDFAQGPLILASLLKCPVYTLFCIKQDGVFNLYFKLLSERIKLPRKDREGALKKYIELYAQRLQYYCLLEPLQWYNFFPYWQSAKQTSTQ